MSRSGVYSTTRNVSYFWDDFSFFSSVCGLDSNGTDCSALSSSVLG